MSCSVNGGKKRARPVCAGRGLGCGLNEARFSEGPMPIVADDDVVAHMDAEDSPGLDEGFGDLPVCLRWRGVAARMFMTIIG